MFCVSPDAGTWAGSAGMNHSEFSSLAKASCLQLHPQCKSEVTPLGSCPVSLSKAPSSNRNNKNINAGGQCFDPMHIHAKDLLLYRLKMRDLFILASASVTWTKGAEANY
jgi:hypothetical protein